MAERITLDPSELTTRTSVDITDWVDPEGVDWGDANVAAVMAEQAVGSSIVDFTVPARKVTIPLNLIARGGTTFATIRSTLQSKVGLFQQQGGYLRRVLNTGGTVFLDVLSASINLGGDWMVAQRDVDTNAVITLDAMPDWYGAEEDMGDNTETTLPEITFTETTASGGDFPLGDRVRVVVDDDQAQNQRGLFWAFRGRNYSSASTASSAYEAEALLPLDTATKVAKVGASGGTVVTHGTLSTQWTPVLGSNIGGTGYMTHVGTHRLRARVFSTSGTTVAMRACWDVGDLVLPSENDAVRLYDGGTFHIVDLGETRLIPSPTGTHRWQFNIQARGDAGGEALSIDRVWIANQDESAGALSAPITLSDGLISFSARSDFLTESGAITGDSLAVGGTWGGTGDADDFSVSAGVCTRAATGDSGAGGIELGRQITASTTTAMTTSAVRLSIQYSVAVAASTGVLLRFTDVNNYVAVYLVPPVTGENATVVMQRRLASSNFNVNSRAYCMSTPVGVYVDLAALINSDGTYAVFGTTQGGALQKLFAGYEPLFASGTLASGKVGIIDYYAGATVNTRSYKSFAAWVPTADAVEFASRSVELNTQGIARLDSGGTAYGPVSNQYGDIPRMPNRSSAGTVEFMAKASRGDLTALPDPGIDDISARVYRRASYLRVN